MSSPAGLCRSRNPPSGGDRAVRHRGSRTHDLVFGQTLATLLRSPGRLRPHRGGGARTRAAGVALKRRGVRGRFGPGLASTAASADGSGGNRRRDSSGVRVGLDSRQGVGGVPASAGGAHPGGQARAGAEHEWTLEGNKAHGRIGCRPLATAVRHNGLVGGARPCSRPLAPSRRVCSGRLGDSGAPRVSAASAVGRPTPAPSGVGVWPPPRCRAGRHARWGSDRQLVSRLARPLERRSVFARMPVRR